jgi:UDP-N-acetylmuramoyl-tripeptide--D-alanyl-D-alanine ligase
MIAHVLSGRYRTHKTAGTRNNRIGVPLTLLEIDASTEAAVIEVGMNQRGELEALTRVVEPTLGVLTNVGLAHVGMFGNERELMCAKGEFIANLPSTATLITNADCERSQLLVKDLANGRRRLSVGGSPEANWRIEDAAPSAGGGYRFELAGGGRRLEIRLRCFGRFNVANAAMAAAAALELGVDEATVARRLASFEPCDLRSQTLIAGGVTIIADCYNANPDSMFAALESLDEAAALGRKFAVLGDMLELGDAAAELHGRIGHGFGAQPVEHLLTVGEWARGLGEAARQAGQAATHCADAAEAAERLAEMLAPGDWVLVKGSRRMRLEEVVETLKDRLGEHAPSY